MLLKSLSDEFILDCRIRGLSPATIETYERNIGLVLRYLESYHNVKALEEVTKANLKQYNLYMLNKGHDPSYVNTINKALKTFYSYLIKEEYTAVNIPSKIPQTKERFKLYHTFNDEEVQRMLRYYDTDKRYIAVRNKTILSVFFDTGCRVKELRSIRLKDVHSNFIEVIGKGNKVRALPISYPLRKQLLKYERARTDYIKRNGKNKHPSQIEDYYFLAKNLQQIKSNENIQMFIKDVARKVKVREIVNASCHTCRHYYAIKSYTTGKADLFTLAHTLGHSNIQTTKRYLKGITNEQVLEKAVESSPLAQLESQNRGKRN